MTKFTRSTFLKGAAVAAFGIPLAACSGSETTTTPGTSSGSSSTSAVATAGSTATAADKATEEILTYNGTEPQNPLLTTMTNEVGGGRVLEAIYAGLVVYSLDGKVEMEIAKSIDTTDNKTFTITLNEGWKFTNGEAVTSKSFVDAWNYGALATNAQLQSGFFAMIDGYEAVAPAEEGAKPTAETLSGLKVVSDTEFTVTLTEPESQFPQRLGYSAYMPLPSDAFKDMAAFGENPIGNGPYKLDGEGAWNHNKEIKLVKNPDYQGKYPALNGGVTIKIYADAGAAYADLQAGNLDILDQIPPEQLATFTSDAKIQAVNQPGTSFASFTIPERLPGFGLDEEGNLRRQALSMAIDRAAVCQKIYQGTRTPASDFTTPALANFDEAIPGNEVLKYDPAKAKELWDQANAIKPWSGEFAIAYNSDGAGNKEAFEAVANLIVQNLPETKAKAAAYSTFKELRDKVTDRSITTAFRTGWKADYPNRYNYLQPLYSSAAADGKGSNDGDYKNPEFDKAVTAIGSAKTPEEEKPLVTAAQAILMKDLPAIPLWYQNAVGGFSQRIQPVTFGWSNYPVLTQIGLK
ncbi:ABC transporter substrate-binding protein [Micrococcales bacterium 31B]|nr:ABC transporter substrate-binding protein [Micrococcales bacterium 31B]